MNLSLRPPDLYRLFVLPTGVAATGGVALEPLPPPVPAAGSAYTCFAGAYRQPAVFVPPLSEFGRAQLYDDTCFLPLSEGAGMPSTAPAHARGAPTFKDELRRWAASTSPTL
jgi:hypothetical protein